MSHSRRRDDPVPLGRFMYRGADRVDAGGRLADQAPTGAPEGRPGFVRFSQLRVPPLVVPGFHPPGFKLMKPFSWKGLDFGGRSLAADPEGFTVPDGPRRRIYLG